jgi:hypothetical protein
MGPQAIGDTIRGWGAAANRYFGSGSSRQRPRKKRKTKTMVRKPTAKYPLSGTKEKSLPEMPPDYIEKRVKTPAWQYLTGGGAYRTEKVPVHPRKTLHGEAHGLPYQAYHLSVEQKAKSILQKIHHAKKKEHQRQASQVPYRYTPEKQKIKMPKEKTEPYKKRFGPILETKGYKMTRVAPGRVERTARLSSVQPPGPERRRKKFRSLARAQGFSEGTTQWDRASKYTGWKKDPIEYEAATHARDRENWITKQAKRGMSSKKRKRLYSGDWDRSTRRYHTGEAALYWGNK